MFWNSFFLNQRRTFNKNQINFINYCRNVSHFNCPALSPKFEHLNTHTCPTSKYKKSLTEKTLTLYKEKQKNKNPEFLEIYI